MKSNSLVLLALVVAVAAFGLGRVLGGDRSPSPRPSVAEPRPAGAAAMPSPLPVGALFPEVVLADRGGTAFALRDLLDGRPLYVLVLGATCGGCGSEVQRWAREIGELPPDVQVIGVAPDSFDAIDGAWTDPSPIFPVYQDVDRAMQAAGVEAVPSGFGLAADGTIVVADYGIRTMPSDRLQRFRDRLHARAAESRDSAFRPARARAE